ncbi:ParA family protein [Acidiferrobacter sp.]|uniref:ParA family protein n=1 Tax=Acidiferrobacter sp. TaxID=1872107 RepID=UPI00262B91C1|nr:ParA family protein [Acidiferrobacter sp.]
MTRVVAITNQKGGVGKTTTSINVAAAIAEHGRRVLLIDLDPQGNATMGSGASGAERGLYDVLLGETEAQSAITKAGCGLDVLAAQADLSGAELELAQAPQREQRLRRALVPLAAHYDHIYIDCPPALSLLTVNALVAADAVLIPMQCEYYALEGLTALLGTIRRVRAQLNPALTIEGLLRTMFDPRNTLALEVSDQLTRHFGGQLFQTIIPRNVRLAEAPSHGMPVIQYDRASRGAQAYLALAAEILAREPPLVAGDLSR